MRVDDDNDVSNKINEKKNYLNSNFKLIVNYQIKLKFYASRGVK